MFACSSQPKFGDLSSWCVKNIPSAPNNFDYPGTNGIITKKPFWGLCPSDPDFVEPPSAGELPAGPWDDMNNLYGVVQVRLNENAAWPESYIQFKTYSTPMWRRPANSTGDWTYMGKSGTSGYLPVQAGQDYVVGMEYSHFGTWDVGVDVDLPAADVSKITNWANAFSNSRTFNSAGMEHWMGVGNQSNIYKMFNNARAFAQDLSNWNLTGADCAYRWDHYTNVWKTDFKPNV